MASIDEFIAAYSANQQAAEPRSPSSGSAPMNWKRESTGTGTEKPGHGSLTDKPGERSYIADWNGMPTKFTFVGPEPEREPGPSGEELIKLPKSPLRTRL